MRKRDRYTITDIAKELGVTRQTVYYWIKKNWVTPKRDYRSYPVFTEKDLKSIKKWQHTLKKGISSSKQRYERNSPSNTAPIATPLTHSTPLRIKPERVEGLTWEEIQKTLYKS